MNIGAYEVAGPSLSFAAGYGTLTFEWTGLFSLQYTDSLTNPQWNNLSEASPLTINTKTGGRFYRLIPKPQ